MIPASWYPFPGVLPSPLLWAWPSNLLLMNRIWSESWDVSSNIRLQKTVTYVLLAGSTDFLDCSFDETCCHVEEAHVARN